MSPFCLTLLPSRISPSSFVTRLPQQHQQQLIVDCSRPAVGVGGIIWHDNIVVVGRTVHACAAPATAADLPARLVVVTATTLLCIVIVYKQ